MFILDIGASGVGPGTGPKTKRVEGKQPQAGNPGALFTREVKADDKDTFVRKDLPVTEIQEFAKSDSTTYKRVNNFVDLFIKAAKGDTKSAKSVVEAWDKLNKSNDPQDKKILEILKEHNFQDELINNPSDFENPEKFPKGSPDHLSVFGLLHYSKERSDYYSQLSNNAKQLIIKPGDPKTFRDRIDKLRKNFANNRFVIDGDLSRVRYYLIWNETSYITKNGGVTGQISIPKK